MVGSQLSLSELYPDDYFFVCDFVLIDPKQMKHVGTLFTYHCNITVKSSL